MKSSAALSLLSIIGCAALISVALIASSPKCEPAHGSTYRDVEAQCGKPDRTIVFRAEQRVIEEWSYGNWRVLLVDGVVQSYSTE